MNINKGWQFVFELHRSHKKYDREPFGDIVREKRYFDGSEVRNRKHMHLFLKNTEHPWVQIRCNHVLSNYYIFYQRIPDKQMPLLLNYGLILYPQDNLYSQIKNLLFPFNYKKAVTLLNYENNSILRMIARIIVLKKVNEEVIDEVCPL